MCSHFMSFEYFLIWFFAKCQKLSYSKLFPVDWHYFRNRTKRPGGTDTSVALAQFTEQPPHMRSPLSKVLYCSTRIDYPLPNEHRSKPAPFEWKCVSSTQFLAFTKRPDKKILRLGETRAHLSRRLAQKSGPITKPIDFASTFITWMKKLVIFWYFSITIGKYTVQ